VSEDLLARPVRPVGGERQVDRAARTGDQADDDRLVALGHAAPLEGGREPPLRDRTACEHHHARGRHVQPMHDQGIVDLGTQARPEAVLLVVAAARHGQQAAGLVDGDPVRIEMKDA
jgi:hypothetical protein